MSLDGYLYRVFLPDASGSGVIETTTGPLPSVDTDAAEQAWCCYAWPLDSDGATRAFFVDQTGVVFQSTMDSTTYNAANAPFYSAAFQSGQVMGGSVGGALPGDTNDGNVWTAAITRVSSKDVVGGVPGGKTISLDLQTPVSRSRFLLLMSFGSSGSLPLGDGRALPLVTDSLFWAAVDPNNGFLAPTAGNLGAAGTGVATLQVPKSPELVGKEFSVVLVTLSPLSPLGVGEISERFSLEIM